VREGACIGGATMPQLGSTCFYSAARPLRFSGMCEDATVETFAVGVVETEEMDLFGTASSLQGFAGVLKRQDGAARATKLLMPRAIQSQPPLAHAIADSRRAPLDHHNVAGRLEESHSPQRAAESPKDMLASNRRGSRGAAQPRASHITIARADGQTSVPGGQLRRLYLADENERLRLQVRSLDDVIVQLNKDRKLLLPRAVAERAAQAQAQQLQVEYDQKLAAERKKHAGELAVHEAALAQASDAIKAEELKLQELEDFHRQELARVEAQKRQQEEQMREQLQSVHAQHDADLEEVNRAHATALDNVREQGQEVMTRLRNRHDAMAVQLEEIRQSSSAIIERLNAEMASLKHDFSQQIQRSRLLKSEVDSLRSDLTAARKSNLELQAAIMDARAEGAVKSEEQRKRATDFEAQLETLSQQHAQLETEAALLRGERFACKRV
jgi:chromosome segregation ATPase